ncbi:MAG: ABC transporter ATP-binding protein [Bacteroidales bacterium]|nr:ABC transporter ATP-binding protein [Bacteroidales bacterium]
MKNIFKLLKYVLNYKKEVSLNILFNILYVFFNLFSIVMIVPFVSILFGLTEAPLEYQEFSLSKDAVIGYVSYWLNYYKQSKGLFACLVYVCAGFVLFTFISNLCRYLGFYFLAPVRNGVLRDLRNDLYKKITILPVSFFASQKRGDIISRMTSDISTVEWSVFTGLQMVIKDPVMIIVYLAALLIASWKFVLIILAILPVPFLLIKKAGESLNRNSVKGQRKAGELLSVAEEALSMVKTTKSLNAERAVTDRFVAANDSYTKTMTRVIARNELASPLTEFFSIAILATVVLIGGSMVLNSQMHPAVLIAFTVIFSRIISPVKELIIAYYNFKKGEAAAQRINAVFEQKEGIEEKANPIQKCTFTDNITFEHVSFQYNDNSNFAVSDVNFTVRKGQKVALVGSSGAGKSTLFDLFMRFIDPAKGTVRIDGTDIREYNINALRSCFGIVTQESILFNDTVRNNIAFGLDDVSDEDIVRAARIANAEEFIEQLPDKYQTVTGDRAVKLSGGQRQRLCIARAVLRNPDILLMDEATSAMDTENEHKVTQAINNAMQGRTMIMIAHRLSTVVDSDMILVMDKGRIVECGTHQQLLQLNGVYSELIKLQTL